MANNNDLEPGQVETAAIDEGKCNACLATFFSEELVLVPCHHQYCSECLRAFFTRAMKDETLYPPKCCSDRIPLRLASGNLAKSFIRRYKAKSLELKTRNKTYCHRPACSIFIAPHSIHNGNACCQRCKAVTCAKCKSAWHWGHCPEEDETGFFEFIKTTRWKRCPECRRIVEKSDGCNHIVFVCPLLFKEKSLLNLDVDAAMNFATDVGSMMISADAPQTKTKTKGVDLDSSISRAQFDNDPTTC